MEFKVKLRSLEEHKKQQEFVDSNFKRIVVRAGRRGGKTVGMATRAVKRFLMGRRVLYATPTAEQINKFWREVKRALDHPIRAGVLYKNETEHFIEIPKTERRIKAKTAWNADTLRGDYADDIIFDEYQLMDPTVWSEVGEPMLLDNDGDAAFVYTPPSVRSRSMSKATDPQHAPKLFARALKDKTGRWKTYHFSSHDNPFISAVALEEIQKNMASLAFRQEILAEDIDEIPGALWKQAKIDEHRVAEMPQDLVRIVVAIDPSVTSKETSDEAGVIAAGINSMGHGFIFGDDSGRDSPRGWASRAVKAYYRFNADRIIGEINNGGEMVELTIRTVDDTVSYKGIHASRGKYTRAEPVSALYERGLVHHVGYFPELENEMTSWVPGNSSPNRMDALVWALTELMLGNQQSLEDGYIEMGRPRSSELELTTAADRMTF